LNFADRATSIPAKIEYHIDRAHSYLLNGISRYRNPNASAFYNELNGGGYNPNALIDALNWRHDRTGRLLRHLSPRNIFSTL
jgi:hypothetical protein